MVGIKRRFAPVFVAGVMVAVDRRHRRDGRSRVGGGHAADRTRGSARDRRRRSRHRRQRHRRFVRDDDGRNAERNLRQRARRVPDRQLDVRHSHDRKRHQCPATRNVREHQQRRTHVRGNTDLDVTVLKADVNVPAGSNCLGFDFKFMSEEYPHFVGQTYNDAFIAELDSSTWTTAGSAITAPNNFAFDSAGEVVSINSTGIGGLTPADGAGTAFDSSGRHPGCRDRASPRGPPDHARRTLGLLLDLRPGRHVYDSAVVPRQPASSASSRTRP